MTRIDGAPSLLALVRSRLAGTGAPKHAPAASRSTPAGVAAGSLQRIAALSTTDPDRRRKALRIYLEAVLVQEFGDALGRAQDLPAMLDAVQAQMDEDPELASAARQAGELLLARPSG